MIQGTLPMLRTLRGQQHLHGWIKVLAMFHLTAIVVACSADVEQTEAYQAACHGEPLRTPEARNKALEDGLSINEQFRCIDKNSFLAMQQMEAERKAANTPAAIAKRKAEDDARDREIAERRAQRQVERDAKANQKYELRRVEINTASASELAHVCGISDVEAAKIVQERNSNGAFANWPDVIHRVLALHAAQNVVFASICGLTVQGQSFEGAPAEEQAAQMIFRQTQR